MTAIEELWRGALEDMNVQQRREALSKFSVYVCPRCGMDCHPPDEVGCTVCQACGHADCGGE